MGWQQWFLDVEDCLKPNSAQGGTVPAVDIAVRPSAYQKHVDIYRGSGFTRTRKPTEAAAYEGRSSGMDSSTDRKGGAVWAIACR